MQLALVAQLWRRLTKLYQAGIIQHFGEKAEVQQVHHGVFRPADVEINADTSSRPRPCPKAWSSSWGLQKRK